MVPDALVCAHSRRWRLCTFCLLIQWGFLLQMCLAAFQVNLLISPTVPAWMRVFHGKTPFEVSVFLLRNFTPFLLVLEQCNTSLAYLADTGSWEHWQRVDSPRAITDNTPESVLNAQVSAALQEEPRVLEQANRQIALLVGAIRQLEQKAVGAPLDEDEGEVPAQEADEKEGEPDEAPRLQPTE